ncbi:MAG TPA: tyrosine-type recombinase/integrase [Gaiellales bacterium]|nr:tyrosine-type recombinase/integrase [Gaiellales bacterium]
MARKNVNPPPYLRNGKWGAKINFRGKQYWVGSFDTVQEWKDAEARLRASLLAAEERAIDRPGDTMPINEYAGDAPDKWPRSHPDGRREVTLQNHIYMLGRFLEVYGDRLLRGGVRRREARDYTNSVPNKSAIRTICAMYNDAIDDELCDQNPFARLGIKHRPGRRDIDVLSPDEVDLLCTIPLLRWPNEFGRMLSVLLRWQAETCMRPGETCALDWQSIDFERNQVIVRRSRNSLGVDTEPKVQQTRIVLPPRAKAALLKMPRLHEKWVFTNQRGNRLLTQTLHGYWDDIRLLFTERLPDGHWLRERVEAGENYDLYELRHFGATWLLEEAPFGLGLKPSDVATQMGHVDGGVRVMTLYGHPRADESRKRILKAMQADWEHRKSTRRPDGSS